MLSESHLFRRTSMIEKELSATKLRGFARVRRCVASIFEYRGMSLQLPRFRLIALEWRLEVLANLASRGNAIS